MATQSGEQIVELVTQMKSTIEQHFVPSLQELEGKLETETGRVRDWIQDITGAIHEVKPLLHDGLNSAVQALKSTEQAVKQDVDHCVQAAAAFVKHVHDGTAHTTELLATATSSATEVIDKLHHADDAHATAHDQIAHSLGDWATAVGQHLETLDTHHNAILESFHGFADQANSHFTDLAAVLSSTGELVAERVGTTMQTHNGNVTELVTQHKDLLVGTVGEAIGGHVGDMIGHVQGFVQTGESLGGVFDGGLGDVLSKVDEISHLLDTIKPVIELAKAIE